MKKSLCVLLTASLFTASGCDQLQTPREAATAAETPAPQGTVLATVNGTPITQPVFDVYTAQRKTSHPGNAEEDQAAILEELINLELMRQEGVSKGLNTSQEVLATLDQQQRTLIASAAIKDFMQNNPVSDETLQQLYDAQVGKPGTEYNARHILVKSKEEAEAIIKELDGGADFEALAKEKSTGPSGASGGQLGWFSAAQMVKPFSDATAQLEKGSYTKEPVQTQFGWHVILLEDSRESTPPAFDEVKDRLKIMVANQQLQQHLKQIRESANVEIAGQ